MSVIKVIGDLYEIAILIGLVFIFIYAGFLTSRRRGFLHILAIVAFVLLVKIAMHA